MIRDGHLLPLRFSRAIPRCRYLRGLLRDLRGSRSWQSLSETNEWSAKDFEEIEAAGLQYIVGVRMRKLKAAAIYINERRRYHQVKENLKVKGVLHKGALHHLLQPEEEV